MCGLNNCVMESAWPKFSISRRTFVWGVPCLTLLGLFGVVGLKWLFNSKSKRRKEISNVSANCSGKSSSAANSVEPTSSVDSEVLEEARYSEDGSEKRSEDCVNDAFRIRPSVHGKQITSSNVSLPPLESQTPLKPVAPIGLHVDAFSEVDSSFSASEGPASSTKSPGNSSSSVISQPLLNQQSIDVSSQHLVLSSCKKNTSLWSGLDIRGQPETEEVPAGQTPTNLRRDRVRVSIQIPRDIVGRFIGKLGRNIKALMVDSNGAHVYIAQKNLPKSANVVSCTVQGTLEQVEEALRIIRAKYPEISVPSSVGGQQTSPVPSPQLGTAGTNGMMWDIKLLPAVIPSTSFSGMVCYIENLTTVWLVACDKSVELDEQHQSMSYTYCYATSSEKDYLQIKGMDKSLLGKTCAVRVSEIHWLRGRITKFGDDAEHYEVQLLDYGSTVIVPPSAIKPLR